MAGIMAPLTAGAFFLGGQKQGAFANEIERQKLELMKRQAMVQGRQLVDMGNGTFRVIDLADPNAAGQTFGTAQDYIKELKAIAPGAPTDMKGMIDAALQSRDPNIAQAVYGQVIKRGGMTPKATSGAATRFSAPYARAMAEHHVSSIADVDAHPEWLDQANRELANESNARIMSRPSTALIPGYDEFGRPTVNPYEINKGARTASPVTTTAPPGSAAPTGGAPERLVGTKLTGPMSTQLQAVNSAEAQIPGIEADFPSVAQKYKANGGSVWLHKQWLLYNNVTNPGGVLGRPDDDVADWFTKVGQLKGQLLAAAGSNSRNLKMVNDLYGKHVVAETQDPIELMNRIRAFRTGGRFDAVRQSIGLPTKGGSAPETPMTKGESLEEKGFVKLPDGIYYNPTTNKYDDGK